MLSTILQILNIKEIRQEKFEKLFFNNLLKNRLLFMFNKKHQTR